MQRLTLVLVALLALNGVSAQTDDLSLAKPYADSIWNALVKLGSIMDYTRTALEVANLDDDMQNGNLKRTFFAMDNSAWEDLAKHYNYPDVDTLLQNQNLITDICLNHLLVDPHTTAFWPPYPKAGIPVDTELTGQVPGGGPNVLHLRTDEAGYYEIVGYVYVGELSTMPNQVNLKAGASIVHTVHDVDQISAVY